MRWQETFASLKARWQAWERRQRMFAVVGAVAVVGVAAALLYEPGKKTPPADRAGLADPNPRSISEAPARTPHASRATRPGLSEGFVDMDVKPADLFAARVQDFMETTTGEMTNLGATLNGFGKKLESMDQTLRQSLDEQKRINEENELRMRHMEEAAQVAVPEPDQPGGPVAGSVPAPPAEKVEWDRVPGAKPRSEVPTGTKGREYVLLPGSSAQGLLLNGVTAPPPGMGGPYPVVVRVMSPFSSPNGSRVPLEGCRVVGGAEADLRSEKVNIRVSRLSCVFPGGVAIDKKVGGYIGGDDGSFGVPGKVIDKKGRQLMYALLAGGASGLAEAIGLSQATSIISPEGTTRTVLTGDILTFGATSALSAALQEVLQFYRKNLEQTVSVVDIPSASKVTILIDEQTTIPELESVTTARMVQ